MAFDLASLHPRKLVEHARSLHGRIERHKESIGTMVEETVRTGEVAAGGAVAALIDHYMGPGGNMPEAMLGPAPLVLTAALVLKGVAFVGGNESWGTHVHSFANGLGAAGTYATMMRILPS